MLELIGKVKYKYISQASSEVVTILKKIKELPNASNITVAEVGLGIGATTKEILNILTPGDTLHLFDFQETVDALTADFQKLNMGQGVNIVGFGSEKKVHSSYAWFLGKMAVEKIDRNEPMGTYDLAYLDGSHTFLHDAAACCVLKGLVKDGGYLILDDVYWSHATSPTWNPEKKPHIRDTFTDDQINTPNVEMVKKLFMDTDADFVEVRLDDNPKPARAIYQKRAPKTPQAKGISIKDFLLRR
ncbi:class I SAM-dependent methyltransferase [Sinorhizobium meliloti]|uniref:class I SAM-dependent methyltransferase n=1 Tax=Rhizobium meliloti TaxID=382 RepID=UPI000FD8C7D8|nr:class I SAM-dependent methyltransferase [Sinorhizobium meliloti]RVN04641.1 hypothetical protein CN112_24965 [Sinorhizobium meliloti]